MARARDLTGDEKAVVANAFMNEFSQRGDSGGYRGNERFSAKEERVRI